MRELIVDRLKKIYKEGITSFYVPGHKHGRLIEKYLDGVKLENLDFTEIDGTDNLHHAEGIILDAQNFASKYYESDSSYFLVNGSTTGILSAISSIGEHGDKILTTRDCHKSVYNAMAINNYDAVYVDINYDYEFDLSLGPSYDDYCNKLLANTDIKAVVLTYPTYNGICYDVKKFVEFAHNHSITVIVDEAHGAHFKMSDLLPMSALDGGADIVIQSTHKMLTSLTQSSILHYKSKLASREALETYLKMYQSSSPSYLLMASIDIAIDISVNQGFELVGNYIENLKKLYSEIDFNYFKNVNYLIEEKHNLIVDPFKINIGISNEKINLSELESFSRLSNNLQCEYSNRKVSLFISSIASSVEDFDQLLSSLNKFSEREYSDNALGDHKSYNYSIEELKIDYGGEYRTSIYKALKSKKEKIQLLDAIGRVSSDMLTPYPPGIPYILPGELITKEKLDMLNYFIELSIEIEGIENLEEIYLINVILE